MKNNYLFLFIGLAFGIIIGVLLGYTLGHQTTSQKGVSNYQDCVDAGYPIMESFPEQCKTPDGKSFTNTASLPQQETVTLEGMIVCLPHINTDGPQTLECAIGLQTDDGTYYALGSDDPIDTAERVRVTGLLKREANSKYQSAGIITVTSYEKIQ